MGTSYLAETMAATGNLWRANELFQETVRYVHEVGLQQGAVFSKANLGLGSLYYEWNQLDLASNSLAEGIRLAEQGGYLDQLLPGCAALARIQNMQGDAAGVQGTIQRARILAEKYGDPPAAVSFINAIEADMAQQRGVLFVVDNWLAYRKHHSADTTNFFSQYEQLTLARILAAKEDYSSMCEVIKPMWELALRQGRVKAAISCDVIMAKCLFMKGDPLPAKAILQRALFKAEPNHFVRSFLDEGGVVISMIKELLASETDRKQDPEECSTEYLYFLLDEAARDTLKASTSRPLSNGVAGLVPADQPGTAYFAPSGSRLSKQTDRPGVEHQLEYCEVSLEEHLWKVGGNESDTGSQNCPKRRAITTRQIFSKLHVTHPEGWGLFF